LGIAQDAATLIPDRPTKGGFVVGSI